MVDILIVEDNEEMAKLLGAFLERENYVVSIAGDGDKALRLFETYGAKLVVLDINLPGLDGFAICSKIRENSNTPILIATAKTDKSDQLKGLELGADDYIEKPYDVDILIAKIKGIFKRRFETEILKEGDIELNTVKQTLSVSDRLYELTVKECELLKLLLENKGTTMKKEFIFNSIWGSDSESEFQTLNVHINGLRKKIESNPKKPEHIITVWGVGYRFE